MKKRINYVICFIIIFFVFSNKYQSLTYGGCEYSQISRLKSLVSNINLSYDYYWLNDDLYFKITVSNIVPGVYFVDSQTGKKYNYSDTIDGEIVISEYKKTTGIYKFYSALGECYGVKLGNKYYNLPTYNVYYDDPLCQGNENYTLCKKWEKVTYSYSQFKKLIDEYNDKKNAVPEQNKVIPTYKKTFFDKLVQIYIDYYYFILIGVIVVCVTAMIISKKRNSFDL